MDQAIQASARAQTPTQAVRVAVLLSCFNRCDTTLRCLRSLLPQLLGDTQQAQGLVYLLDNGTDGTGAAVAAEFPQVVVWSGQPDWYWNQGMRQLWQRVITHHPADYYLWLNDDVQLEPDAIERLLAQAQQLQAVSKSPLGALVGTMASTMASTTPTASAAQSAGPTPSYGGRRRRSWWNPLAFGAVLQPQDQPQQCDFINGNLCLIPAAAVSAVGILAADYAHGSGDFDYGLRLKQAGFQLWVAPGFYGACATNSPQGSVFDAAVPMSDRLAMLNKPNVLPPPAEWRLFVRRHGGWMWPLLWSLTWFRQCFPRSWLYLKQRHFPLQSGGQLQCGAKPVQVLIVQQVFKQYRQVFFQQLAAALGAEGAQLTVAFSQAQGAELAKNDNINEAVAGLSLPVRSWRFGALIWQHIPNLHQYDVVITEQANRHLLNYWLLLRRLWQNKPAVVFWGHGFNHQAGAGYWSAAKEWFKRLMLRAPDAFFAYTAPVALYVQQQGVAANRVTVINNSLDTSQLASQVKEFNRVKPASAPYTLLFCGSLYPDKQLSVVLSVTQALVQQGLVSKLIVVGDGPDRHLVSNAQAPWLDYRGACFAQEKARAFAEADVLLNPGLIGLVVLDAFAAGLPVVTTDFAGHSPEIAYLQHQHNALILPAAELLAGLVSLLTNPAQIQSLSVAARNSAQLYSLDAMVQAFVSGLRPWLKGAD